MSGLKYLFDQNRLWSDETKTNDPGFFDNSAQGQQPEFMWIGCSDSRVPATQLLGLKPGDLFVHRNIANQVSHADQNCLSAIHYAVFSLKVKHIILCGHYDCGGIKASFEDPGDTVVDDWLKHLREVRRNHAEELTQADFQRTLDHICEINVRWQVLNICRIAAVEKAWAMRQKLTVHGWIYDIKSGLLEDLNCSVSGMDQLDRIAGV